MTVTGYKTGTYLKITRTYSLHRVFGQALLLASVVYCIFSGIFFKLHITFLGVLSLCSAVLCIVLYLFVVRRKIMGFSYVVICLDLVMHVFFNVKLTGWDTGFHYYIMMIIPSLFYAPDIRMFLRAIGSFSLGLVYCAIYFYSCRFRPQYDLPVHATAYLNYFNMINIFILFMVMSYIMHRALGKLESRLRTMNEELSYLASVDPLTKILNRRSMDEFISAILQREGMPGLHTAFIVADIDNFKAVNDTWGHKCGDMVLEEVSRVMAGAMREGDRIARWGGEEFLAVITYGSAEGALILAERMRKAVSDSRINFNGHEISVTATFGVSIRKTGDDARTCIDRADSAMYHGKRSGRNRVVAWSPDL